MNLDECKVCNHHICVLDKEVLCGFTIDRAQIPVVADEDNIDTVDCPKEQSVA